MAKPLLYEVRESSIHNRGVFAAKKIDTEVPIIQYVGEKISKKESDRRSVELIEKASLTGEAAVYIFTLNDEFDLDGAVGENPARYINHSCDPNCEAYIENDEVWIYSIRKIRKGEELVYNYGFDLTTWEDHPCRCGSKNCVGYIVAREFWDKLDKKIEKKHKELKKELTELRARAEKRDRKTLKKVKDEMPKAKKPVAKTKKKKAAK